MRRDISRFSSRNVGFINALIYSFFFTRHLLILSELDVHDRKMKPTLFRGRDRVISKQS